MIAENGRVLKEVADIMTDEAMITDVIDIERCVNDRCRYNSDLWGKCPDVMEGEPVAYDIGKFQDRYFSYVASFGAFTAVSYNTSQYIKNALGHTAYLLSGIQELSQIRTEHIRMVLDEERIVEDDFLFGAICNATSVGGVLTLDPNQVDMSDGHAVRSGALSSRPTASQSAVALSEP